MWLQKEFRLRAKSRGFHLVTDEVISALPELKQIECGLLHLFIQHTSASLSINENADPTVREDLENHFNHLVPEGAPYYRHDYEGDDDMPAHIKNCSLPLRFPLLPPWGIASRKVHHYLYCLLSGWWGLRSHDESFVTDRK